MVNPVSRWAGEVFGAVAGRLAETIPACLVEAHARARHAHEQLRTRTQEAYGHGLHAAQYETLAAGLAPIRGTTSRRLQGRTVTVVGGNAILPIRYAQKNVPVTEARLRKAYGFRADLIRRHGPKPIQLSFDLGMEDLDEDQVHPDVALLPPDLQLVIVAYACSLEQGVMRVEWGSAGLLHGDRHLTWHHHEPLFPPADPRAA
ncbi:hypothetical protein GCM10010302_24690 [Streptomyces polychromogenes]|uniref:Uncharacterized protein n=1 Tax=Streptomyces polychromogenes TaxID=67342 RepID=A0ABP3F295_9ACTN